MQTEQVWDWKALTHANATKVYVHQALTFHKFVLLKFVFPFLPFKVMDQQRMIKILTLFKIYVES